MSKKQAVKEAAEEVVKEVKATAAVKDMDAERKSLYNKVMDAIEDFEATLELEHSALGEGAWAAIKSVMYTVARAAIYSTKKGLEYIQKFLTWAKKQLKKGDVKGRITRAWNKLTEKKEIQQEAQPA